VPLEVVKFKGLELAVSAETGEGAKAVELDTVTNDFLVVCANENPASEEVWIGVSTDVFTGVAGLALSAVLPNENPDVEAGACPKLNPIAVVFPALKLNPVLLDDEVLETSEAGVGFNNFPS
jgi:hypothetical protein